MPGSWPSPQQAESPQKLVVALLKWQSWDRKPQTRTINPRHSFPGNALPPKDWWLLPWLWFWSQERLCVDVSQEKAEAGSLGLGRVVGRPSLQTTVCGLAVSSVGVGER